MCAAVGCSNRSVRVEEEDPSRRKRSFHKFPLKKPVLLKAWLHHLKRQGFAPKEHHILCSDHFTNDCFEVSLEVRHYDNRHLHFNAMEWPCTRLHQSGPGPTGCRHVVSYSTDLSWLPCHVTKSQIECKVVVVCVCVCVGGGGIRLV